MFARDWLCLPVIGLVFHGSWDMTHGEPGVLRTQESGHHMHTMDQPGMVSRRSPQATCYPQHYWPPYARHGAAWHVVRDITSGPQCRLPLICLERGWFAGNAVASGVRSNAVAIQWLWECRAVPLAFQTLQAKTRSEELMELTPSHRAIERRMRLQA